MVIKRAYTINNRLGSSLIGSLKENRGSYTLEATIAVPFFLLLLVFLINLISVSAVYIAMDHAVSETAKIIAGTAFPLRDLRLSVPGLNTGTVNSKNGAGPVSTGTLVTGMGTELFNDILKKASEKGTGIVLDTVGNEVVSRLIKEYYPLKKLGDDDFRLVEVRLLSKKKKQEPGLSKIDLKQEDITIVVVYKVKMPFPFVSPKEFILSNIAVERAWTDG